MKFLLFFKVVSLNLNAFITAFSELKNTFSEIAFILTLKIIIYTADDVNLTQIFYHISMTLNLETKSNHWEPYLENRVGGQ